MPNITLDGGRWQTEDDFYGALLLALEAPDGHGYNLDALWDSIVGGGLNHVNPPFCVRFTGIATMSPTCRELVVQFFQLAAEATAEGQLVHVTCEP